ncbi:MAG: tryptophan--tRNA ligase [Candidatus Brennerbacteria bacterium]|nr:tryptophan--tRNA ligase [Candidatus Brennerbacteria bacterium]
MKNLKPQNLNTKLPRLISGIQPTGRLHIGNYLGALKNFVDLQNSGKYECYFFIADLHALTENPKPEELKKNIVSLAADYLAAGLNPKKSTIFIQSFSSAVTELAWTLSAITPLGELNRMTQFKEKSSNFKLLTSNFEPRTPNFELRTFINTGLFTYPVLMAADILLYDAEFVPVGEDQLQHLELARTLARKFNNRFGPASGGTSKTFVEPKPILTETPRVMSLDDPHKKMSKSRPEGCLFLDDSQVEMREKIKKAVTDSGREIKFNPEKKPAISNLIGIFSALTDAPIKDIEKKYKNKGYGDFKKELAEAVIEYFAPFRKTSGVLQARETQKIKTILKTGAKKANIIASRKLMEVKNKLGLSF